MMISLHIDSRYYYALKVIIKLIIFSRAVEPEPQGDACFWSFVAGAAWRKKNRSRRRLEKKSGAGATKILAGSSALHEDKKHKEIVL